MKMRAYAALCLAVVGSGCSTIYNPRADPPDATFTASTDLDATASCLVASLNEAFKSGGYTHRIDIIEPGKVYEVTPQKQMVLSAEVYFIRVTSSPSGTRIEPFVVAPMKAKVVAAAKLCSTLQ